MDSLLTDVIRLQIYLFKPIQVTVSTVFLLLLIYTIGKGWAMYMPKASWVEGTRFSGLAPVLHFINPGEFRIKEVRIESSAPVWRPALIVYIQHVIASLVASTAAAGSTAVQNFAVQRVGTASGSSDKPFLLIGVRQLYYNTNVEATTAVLATFSTACFGCVHCPAVVLSLTRVS